MKETDLQKIVTEYSDIIKSIEKLEISEEEQILAIKAKLILFDGTIVWVREIRIKGIIEAYSYYWLRSDESVIIGWDNAPHHREVNSFPYHQHIGTRVEASKERNLGDVLSFIREFLG